MSLSGKDPQPAEPDQSVMQPSDAAGTKDLFGSQED